MKRLDYVSLLFCTCLVLTGCQNHPSPHHHYKSVSAGSIPVIKSSSEGAHRHHSKDEAASTISPSPQDSSSEQLSREDQLAKLNKANYLTGLPGPLPIASVYYTITIDLTKGYASLWKPSGDHLAIFNQLSPSDAPNGVIDGHRQGHFLLFSSVPSASKDHPDIFGIGGAPDYGMNTPIAIYTNPNLADQNEVHFVMGHAMGVEHFVTDTRGNKLNEGKAFSTITGNWFKLKTGTWYNLKETEMDPDTKTHLVYRFKLDVRH